MKMSIKHLFLLAVLLAGVGLMAGQLTAQTLTTLHSFTGGTDGANPWAGLLLSGNILYGTASSGGLSNRGTVFAINTNGTGFRTLYSFTGGDDGDCPIANLILSNDRLYGTAGSVYGGASSGNRTVFALNTDGTGFTVLHSFTAGSTPTAGDYYITNFDGAYPGKL